MDRTELDWQEQQARWLAGIRACVRGYDATAYAHFIARCGEIQRAERRDRPGYPLKTAVTEALLAACVFPVVFVDVIRRYLQDGNPLRLGPWGIVPALIKHVGGATAFEVLSSGEYKEKRAWQLAFFRCLPKEQVCAAHLDPLYSLYEQAEATELPSDLGHLERYADMDPTVTHRVASILTRRADKDPNVAMTLGSLFEHRYHSGAKEAFYALLAGDPALLRRAYFAYLTNDAHADYDGKAFNTFLDKDPDFIDAYLNWINERADRPRLTLHERDNYDFLWKRSDYASTAVHMVKCMYENAHERGRHWGTYPERLFLAHIWEEAADKDVRARQDDVLGRLLLERGGDEGFVLAMFQIIACFSSDRKLAHVKTLIGVNRSIELFRKLSLEPSHMGWRGSKVPRLEERAAFWQSLRSVFGSLEFLTHRKFVEEALEYAREALSDQQISRACARGMRRRAPRIPRPNHHDRERNPRLVLARATRHRAIIRNSSRRLHSL